MVVRIVTVSNVVHAGTIDSVSSTCYLLLKQCLRQNLYPSGEGLASHADVLRGSSLRDSIYKLYINTVYLLLKDAKLHLRDSIYKLYINTVCLFLRDAKLLLMDSIYKLYINTVCLFLRDAKLLLRDSIYKLYMNKASF